MIAVLLVLNRSAARMNIGAGGRNRTGTVLPPADFESDEKMRIGAAWRLVFSASPCHFSPGYR